MASASGRIYHAPAERAKSRNAVLLPDIYYGEMMIALLASDEIKGKLDVMPSKTPVRSLQEVVDAVGVYPPEAYVFVQQGLGYTVDKIHQMTDPDASHHVGGKELCEGLRDLALKQWGLMARLVLARWSITTTMDFGRIVFAMVEHDLLQKTDEDHVEDFRQVYDFRAAFETNYKIEPRVECEAIKQAGKKS